MRLQPALLALAQPKVSFITEFHGGKSRCGQDPAPRGRSGMLHGAAAAVSSHRQQQGARAGVQGLLRGVLRADKPYRSQPEEYLGLMQVCFALSAVLLQDRLFLLHSEFFSRATAPETQILRTRKIVPTATTICRPTAC